MAPIAHADESIDRLMGLFIEANSSDFVALDSLGIPTNKPNMWLDKRAAAALLQAYQAFKKAHPTLPFTIISATRNFNYQKQIWSRKWQAPENKNKNALDIAHQILRYSSMPGSSRHHWGTDVDINALNSRYFMHDKKGNVVWRWLQENMPKYGFCQPYSSGRTAGYQTEEWHWSYRPLAKEYIDQYASILKNNPQQIVERLTFVGSSDLPLKTLLETYVFSVSAECK